jgi:hypothetical protein
VVFRDHLTYAAHLSREAGVDAYGLHTVEERSALLSSWTKKAIASMIEGHDLSEDQASQESAFGVLQRARMSISVDSLPFKVLLDIIANLCFRSYPKSNR